MIANRDYSPKPVLTIGEMYAQTSPVESSESSEKQVVAFHKHKATNNLLR